MNTDLSSFTSLCLTWVLCPGSPPDEHRPQLCHPSVSDLPSLSRQPSSVLQADSLDADAGQTMNIDLSSVTEATINAEGHLVLNGVGDDAGKEPVRACY